MADFLIRHLEKKGQEHSSLAMLVNQWGFDQLLIPKALQNVGSLFPHYSRHDESHSKQILVNIERLLADNLSLLTATDTWLLLEAAYWHDIGMVVPQKALEDALAEQGFKDYLAELSRNEHHELHQLASQFDASNPCQCFAGAHSPVDAVDKFRQLMAEWFRRQHARRASEVVQSPWQTIGLNSPRTELIPSRLFRLLGQICLMHGSDFDTMMERLPFREAGMAKEDCHPRFVACLLRLGDLLDLDDNRFCPVMQNIAGDNRPALSKAHEAKHQSIRHLRMDRDRIEVSAECEDIDSYLETWKWFDWLKQEMQQQMSRWSDIAPCRKLGVLPTLGELKVSLKGQKILRDGERPQFSIDGKNAVKLLQGTNLYSNRFAFVQELVQNAIDATLIRIWLTDGKQKPEDWKNPLNDIPQQVLHDLANAVKINITVTDEGCEDGMLNCTVTISDAGTGIRKEDLAYMLKIGGSRENAFRQHIVLEMPEWMRPSGIFGIGLQSAFIHTDVIEVSSVNIFNRNRLKIKMHSPLKKNCGLVEIYEDKPEVLEYRSGSEFSVSFLTERHHGVGHVIGDRLMFQEEVRSKIDPLKGEVGLVASFIDSLLDRRYIASPLLYISANILGEPFSINCTEIDTDLAGWEFYSKEGSQMLIKNTFSPEGDFIYGLSKWLSYRGRRVEFKSQQFPFCSIDVDLLSGKAEEWLELNRERLTSTSRFEMEKLILGALKSSADKLTPSQNSIDQSLYVAMLERLVDGRGCVGFDEKWKDYVFKYGDFKCGEWRIGDILGKDGFKFLPGPERVEVIFEGDGINQENKPKKFFVGSTFWLNILVGWEVKLGRHLCGIGDFLEDGHGRYYRDIYKFSTTKEPRTEKSKAGAIYSKIGAISGRLLLEVEEHDQGALNNFKQLDIQVGEKIPGVMFVFPLSKNDAYFILLPYRFWPNKENGAFVTAAPEEIDFLCYWIKPRLKDKRLTIAEIREKYQNLIDYIDNDLMPSQGFGKEWAHARGLPHPEPSASTAGAPTDPTQQ